MNALLTKATVLKMLAVIYHRALTILNGHVALWAMKWQTKAVSLFAKQLLLKAVHIADMKQGQLTEFIERLENHAPIKEQGGKPVSARFPP